MDAPDAAPPLTPSQSRLLVYMDTWGPQWFPLIELERTKLLETGDVLAVPSLIERKLVMHLASMNSVALTAAGTVIADEIRSKGEGS